VPCYFHCEQCKKTYSRPLPAPEACSSTTVTCEPSKHIRLLQRYDRDTQTSTLVNRSSVTQELAQIPLDQFPYEVRFLIMHYLVSPSGLGKLMMISRQYLQVVRPYLHGLVEVSGLSTIESASILKEKLTLCLSSSRSSLLAFDQVFFDELKALRPNLTTLSLAYGSRGEGDNTGITQQQVVPTLGKMHNKFGVFRLEDGRYVTFTGSPNLSEPALKGRNIESALIIDSHHVGYLFKEYHALLLGTSTKSRTEFSGLVDACNQSGGPVRLAFAPYQSVADFVVQEIAGADSVFVRMFLISPKYKRHTSTDETDPETTPDMFEFDEPFLNALVTLEKSGASVCVVVDKGSFKQDYVSDAAKYLKQFAPSIQLFTEGGRTSKGIMHDKLILVRTGSRYKVLLGSSGMTTNNYDQQNYENMIAFDGQPAYDYFLTQHTDRLQKRTGVTAPTSYKKKWK
jgi:hypothetical protein